MQQHMMQNGMPGQVPPVASMQRPQPGNPSQQIFARIIHDLKQAMPQFNGSWQATLDPRIRANYIMQLTTTLNMLEPDVAKCLQIAQKFEHSSISGAQNRPQYEQSMAAKLDEIKQKRAQRAGMQRPGPINLQQQMSGNGMNAQDTNSLMQSQQMNNINAGMQPLGFPAQLQRPMQPSMLQPSAQRPTTMDPSFLMTRPDPNSQFTMGMNVNSATDMAQQQDLQQANVQAQNDHSIEIQQLAQQFMAQMAEPKRNELRKQLYAQMSEQQRAMYNSRQGDPLKTFVISKARQEVAKRKAAMQGQGMQMQPQGQRPQQFGTSDQLSMVGLNLDQQGQQSGNAFSSLSQLYGQQANALKMQESGEQVVPVSDNNMFQNANLNMLAQNPKPTAADAQRQMLLQQQQQNQKQLQDRMINQRNSLARAQAMNAQQQAGNQGLNIGNAMNNQISSPAMSMLNRPMQGADGQQAFSQGMQNFNALGGDANALAQHHQSMINQNNTNGMPQGAPQAMSNQALTALLNSLPPEVRNRILAMPPLERNVTLARFKAAQDVKMAQQNRQLQMQMPVDQQSSNNINGNISSNPNAVQANLMNLLPLTQQQGGNPSQLTAEQMQRHRQQQAIRSQAMLSRPLPRHIANQLQISIPPQVQKWGQLRQHIQMHQMNMPPDMSTRMVQAMERHFAENPLDLQQGMKDVVTMHQQQQNAQRAALSGAMPPQPTGMANPNAVRQFAAQPGMAQMSAAVAPTQPAQLEMNGTLGGFGSQISAQEIAQIRMLRKIGPHVSDEQIRQALIQRRMSGMAHAKQSQAANAQANLQAQTVATANANARPTPALKRTPGAQPAAQINVTPKLPQQTNKRAASSSDDVVEIPNPNAAKKPAQTVTAQQKMLSQMPMPTPEQLAKLPDEQRKRIQQQLANMQRVSQTGQSAAVPMKPSPSMQQMSQADAVRAQAMKQQNKMLLTRLHNELGQLAPKGPPVKVEPAQVQEVKAIFRKMWKPLQALDQTLSTAYKFVPEFKDENAKQLLKAKHMFDHNMADEEGNIKGYLSANLVTFKQMCHLVMQYYTDVQKHTPKRQPGDMSAPSAQVSAPPRASVSQQGSAVPMAVSKSNNKAGIKPPSAPIDDKKFWSNAASPHGVPKYDTQKPDLMLKMPPGKKRKTGPNSSQPTTPAQSITPSATPKLPSGKVDSVVKPTAKPAQPELEKVRHRCPHIDACDASISGFETEAQLKAHLETAHAAIGDPLAFFMEATADVLKAVSSAKLKASAVFKTKSQATPMAKLPSKQSSKSTPGKAGLAPETTAVKQTGLSEDADIQATMTAKLGFPAKAETANASGKDASLDLEDNFMAGLGDILKGSLDDIDPLSNESIMQVDDWSLELPSLTSPELTPGNGSDSSRDSDISINDQLRLNLTWDPFHTGDTQMPDFYKLNDDVLTTAEALATGKNNTESTAAKDTIKSDTKNKVDIRDNPINDAAAAATAAAAPAKDSAEEWAWMKDDFDWDGAFNSNTTMNDSALAWDDTMAF